MQAEFADAFHDQFLAILRDGNAQLLKASDSRPAISGRAEILNSGFTDSYRGEHRGPMRDGFVAGQGDRAVQGFCRKYLHIAILSLIAGLCLDSKCRKPITYKAYIVSEKREIKLPSRIESVEEAAAQAAEFAQKRGLGDEFIYAVDLALRESVANAVKHGNKFDESKTVEIKLEDGEDGFAITVRDHGAGFSVDEIPDPTNPENLLKTNGRGILFMNSFMDEIEWSNSPDGGLIVKMVKLKSEKGQK